MALGYGNSKDGNFKDIPTQRYDTVKVKFIPIYHFESITCQILTFIILPRDIILHYDTAI